jgi:transcriptional regulator with XRE-family HTH domain
MTMEAHEDLELDEADLCLREQAKAVALHIKEEREKVHLSQMELSFKAGLSQNQVFCIESGKRVPNLYTILKLCKALGISPAALFEHSSAERSQARETIISLVQKYI